MSFLRNSRYEGGPTRAEVQYARLSEVLFPDAVVVPVDQGEPFDARIEALSGQPEPGLISQHSEEGFGKRAHVLRFVTLGSVEG